MRFLVAWDGSELSTLALRATISTWARSGDQLLVYHVANRGRYGASEEFELESLQSRLRDELEAAKELRVLVQTRDGDIEDVDVPCSPRRRLVHDGCADASGERQRTALLTVHEKESSEAAKISKRIIDFAGVSGADVLVMGSVGVKSEASATFQRVTLGSSAHLAALSAPCTVVLIRPGFRCDPSLRSVYMVAVDGSNHSYQALELCSEWARYDKDEIVCHVFGPPEFTQPIEERCTGLLQQLMRSRKVEYAVIPTELEDSADMHGDELAEAAKQCRFRQQAMLVFGACGRQAETTSPDATPASTIAAPAVAQPATLGHVARWCICEAQCSLIVARIKASPPPCMALARHQTAP